MPKRVKLSNAIEITNKYPQRLSDDPPNYQQISMLEPEDYARLKARAEYFWVKVDAVEPFVGIVQEEPTFDQQFKKGDKVYFESFNVYDVKGEEWLNSEGI